MAMNVMGGTAALLACLMVCGCATKPDNGRGAEDGGSVDTPDAGDGGSQVELDGGSEEEFPAMGPCAEGMHWCGTGCVPLAPGSAYRLVRRGSYDRDVAQQVVRIALGDFDSDRKPDLAYTDHLMKELRYRPNTGDGSFAAAATLTPFGHPYPVLAADVDSDGKMDLVSAGSDQAVVSVFLGEGGGAFAPRLDSSGLIYSSTCLAVGQLDGDAFLDVAAGSETGGIVLLRMGNGDGTFARTGGQLSAGKERECTEVQLVDLDGDEKSDLVTTDGEGAVQVFLGKGDGTFAPRQDFSVSTPERFDAADLNQDGTPDLAVACLDPLNPALNSRDICVLLGRGNGTFGEAVRYDADGARAVRIGDVTGDGLPDIVAGGVKPYTKTGLVQVLEGNGDGTFKSAVAFEADENAPVDLALADLDGDGWVDVVTAQLGTVSVLRGACR